MATQQRALGETWRSFPSLFSWHFLTSPDAELFLYELEEGSGPNQVDPAHTLAHTLRETLGLTGTKISCDNGACGSCTVLMDEKAVLSCMTLTVECGGRQITTIEGLSNEFEVIVTKKGDLDNIARRDFKFLHGSLVYAGYSSAHVSLSCISTRS
jgi:hypothetical protein